MFRRAGGNFYARDKITGRSESLGTSEPTQARQLLAARNQAAAQPQLNRTMAKAYLSAKSPDLLTRTWADVMEHYSVTGVESTRKRKATAFRSRPFAHLRGLALMDTEGRAFVGRPRARAGRQFGRIITCDGCTTTRCIWDGCSCRSWLTPLGPRYAKGSLPPITEDEHRRIVDREHNLERKLYYELLWETGGAQTDIASLHADQIDLKNETIHFRRRKLAGRESGGESLLRIGPSLKKLLLQLPKEGCLFPKVNAWNSNTRSSEFCRRCRMLGIEGRSLHSYRYAWAQRARAAGMPEREAMNHLGHESRAIHAAYAGGATVATLPLELYEAQKREKVVQFTAAA